MQADKISETVGIVVATVFITLLLAEFLLVRLLKKNYFSSEFLVINLSIASLQQLTDVLNKVIFISAFIYVQQHYSIQKYMGWHEITVENPFPVHSGFPYININAFALFNYLFVLVLADFCQYWLHRFSHEINIMWAGHITHHSNTEYNFSVALRQNALENIYTWVFFLPLAFCGIPWQMFVAAYAVSLIWQFFVHTRLINKMGVLELFMSTPSHHRVHHGKNPQYIDKNYGAFFIVWDKWFGTFEPENEPVEYGIIKPLQSQNPIWSNVHHHVHIIKTASAATNLKERLKVIFGPPAFVPSGQHPVTEIPAQSNSSATFTQQPEKKLYVFINYIAVAVAAFLLINRLEETMNLALYVLTVIATAVCFSIFTALLENKHWADYAEVIRLLIIFFAGIIISFQPGLFLPGVISLTGAVLLLATTWFIAARYKQHLVYNHMNNRHL
jgi:sterol desaturase/sphingolipid hydroxylase (fatty acid hydroxylase superfamily)